MGSSKAFVFSLDAFVAFVLTVAALYSLLFFSTVPSAYYSSLMQANYLAKDTLLTLATTIVEEDADYCTAGETYLSCVVSSEEAARTYIGSEASAPSEIGVYDPSALVPAQFGYKLERINFEDVDGEIDFYDEATEWALLYNTADHLDSANKKEYNKLKAAAHALYFGYVEPPDGWQEPPLQYMTCGGENTICSWPEPFVYYYGYDEGTNMEIAGEAEAYVVRLTVYT